MINKIKVILTIVLFVVLSTTLFILLPRNIEKIQAQCLTCANACGTSCGGPTVCVQSVCNFPGQCFNTWPAYTCSDGSRVCSLADCPTTPPPPTNCTPNAIRCGSADGCDRVQCLPDGSGEVVIGAGECCSPPPPACTSSAPTAPALTAPADNAMVNINDVPLSWSVNGGWGTGCPSNNNRYNVYASVNCSNAGYVNVANVDSSVTNMVLNDLTWGSTYCWYVQKSNGSQTANSAVWRFTVNSAPSILSSNPAADACGYGFSGRPDSISANLTNPLTYTSSFSDPEGDPFTDIIIAFVPQSAVNTATADYNQVYSAVLSNRTIAVRLQNGSAGVLNSGFTWNTLGGGANITNNDNTATLLNAGTSSNMTTSGNTAQGNSTIRFLSTFPSGIHNVYLMALTQNPDGTIVSSNQGSSSTWVMTRVGTWGIDMTNPTSQIIINNFSGNTFTGQWSGSDANGLRSAYSYIYASETGSTLTDTTGGFAISPLGTTVLTYPDSANAGIGIAQLPANRQYSYSGSTVSYTFALALEDRACNIYTATAGAQPPFPWIYTREGIISANAGISNMFIPSTLSITIPDFLNPGSPSNNFVSSNAVNLSTNTALSGTTALALPVNQISTRNTYTYNYLNDAVNPDPRSNTSSWYNYVLDTLNENSDAEMFTVSTAGSITRSGNISSYIDSLKGSASNTTNIYAVNITASNLTLDNLTCDRKVIFVSSQPISVIPPLNKTSAGGCIFVSTQDITINNGNSHTTTLLSPGGNSQYDVVNGYFITDGTFTTTTDSSRGLTYQWDGLLIRGGVLTGNTNLSRDLNSSANTDQPAEIYQYDPFYSLEFKDALASRFYSIREYIP